MLKMGLNIEDIEHIEYLNNPKVLKHLEGGKRFLERNQKQNVILYFQAWISLLTEMNQRGEDWCSMDLATRKTVELVDS